MAYACDQQTVTLPTDANGNVIQSGGAIQCSDANSVNKSPLVGPFVGPLVTPSNGLTVTITNPLTYDVAGVETENTENIIISECDDFGCYSKLCPGQSKSIPVAAMEAIFIDAKDAGFEFEYVVSNRITHSLSISK